MKHKICAILILCVLILTCSSCSNEQAADTASNISEYNDCQNGDYPTLNISSFDEYQEFIDNTALPENFIEYSVIKSLGEFDEFICLSDARYNDYTHCMYSLRDSNNYEFIVYIDNRTNNETDLTTTTYISNVTTTNMRTVAALENGIYLHEGVEYSFISGKLLFIKWSIDETELVIMGGNGRSLSEYPLDSNTALGKLMNTNTASSVITSISPNHIES